MLGMLVLDSFCSLLKGEEDTPSGDGTNLAQIVQELRALSDFETPTITYMNWMAERIAQIQRRASTRCDPDCGCAMCDDDCRAAWEAACEEDWEAEYKNSMRTRDPAPA